MKISTIIAFILIAWACKEEKVQESSRKPAEVEAQLTSAQTEEKTLCAKKILTAECKNPGLYICKVLVETNPKIPEKKFNCANDDLKYIDFICQSFPGLMSKALVKQIKCTPQV